jgi:uncharacterized protein (TIGR02246 family)
MLAARTFSALIFALLSLSACQPKAGNPAPLTDADRKAIIDGVARLDQAVLSGDARAATALYADDALLGPPHTSEVRGHAAIQKFFEGFPRMSAFKEHVKAVDGLGDIAYVWATFDVVAHPPDVKSPVKDTGKVLAIWRKQPDGSWLVSRAAWNSDLAPKR